jgi:iron complex transport system substrate-binding protein
MPRNLVWSALFIALFAHGAADAARFTDAAGRVVALPDTINKVAAAGPPAEALMFALAPEKLAGWVSPKTDKDKDFMLDSVTSLPVLGRLTGKDADAAIASIKKAKPDVIIDVGDVNAKYKALADKLQKETGIPYVLIDGRLANTDKALQQVGDLLGVNMRQDTLASSVKGELEDIASAFAKVPLKDRARIYYGCGKDGLQTGSQGSINTEFIDAVGAVNVAAKAGTDGLVDVTVKQVVEWNPDIIIAEDPAFFASVTKDPAWAGIKAVKDKRVYILPSAPYGWLDGPPGVNRMMGILWLETVLYPKQADGDILPKLREFYNEFYQVDLIDQQIDEMFEGTSLQQH